MSFFIQNIKLLLKLLQYQIYNQKETQVSIFGNEFNMKEFITQAVQNDDKEQQAPVVYLISQFLIAQQFVDPKKTAQLF